ncbi:MAG: hypothetical protein M3362_00095 [Acidobacteriota bacterium]|nr:hypothetical protein [Acidobacteriota bacterium]
MNWGAKTDFDVVCKRAAGRRRYNAKRREEARERYLQVVEAIMPTGGRKRGTQAQLARVLGVHRSTICRDVAKWRRLLLEVMRRYRSLIEAEGSMVDADKHKKVEAIVSAWQEG